jgi:NADH-quinone oxidoreductase subunit N
MLVALLAGGDAGVPAALFYLLVYFLSTLTAWGAIGEMSTAGRGPDALEDYRGLAWRRPWVTAALALALLSLAGLPVTAGLIGKFYIVWAGVSARLWVLVGCLVAGSAVSLYYYLRVLAALFSRAEEAAAAAPVDRAGGLGGRLTVGAAAGLLVLIGVWPGPGISLITALVSGLK